jgi:hypothetical protein
LVALGRLNIIPESRSTTQMDSHIAAADLWCGVASADNVLEARGRPINSARAMMRRSLIHIFLTSTQASALLVQSVL